MTKQASKLGQLLVKSGAVKQKALKEHLALSKDRGCPIGQSLMEAELINKYQLLAALRLQSLLHDQIIETEQAIDALRLIYRESLDLEQALSRIGVVEDDLVTSKLGELLVDAGLIDRMQLFMALATSFENCTPLGQSLIQMNVLDIADLETVLAVQKKIRSNQLARDKGVAKLKSLAKARSS